MLAIYSSRNFKFQNFKIYSDKIGSKDVKLILSYPYLYKYTLKFSKFFSLYFIIFYNLKFLNNNFSIILLLFGSGGMGYFI